jgi:hypothetical protein
LYSAPFDADRQAVTAPPVRALDDVAVATFGGPMASVSYAGTLVYASTATTKKRLVWVNREGLERSVTEEERDYSVPRLSPDGRIAVGALFGTRLAFNRTVVLRSRIHLEQRG